MAWNFNRELIIHLDRKVVAGLDPYARSEMESFICDALHTPEFFGPRTFITFQEEDFSQFEIRGAGVSQEIDDAAWERVVHYLKNAHTVTRVWKDS